VVQLVASHDVDGTPPAFLIGVGHSGDLTIGAQNWAGQAMVFGGLTFLRPGLGHGVFRPQPDGLTQFNGLAQRGPR